MSEIISSTPAIVENDDNLYDGDLVKYYQALFYNAQNLRHPYHNYRHTGHVFWLCFEACRYYGSRLTRRQVRNLLIAAMFHDFNHAGRMGDDDLNIVAAVRALEKYIQPEDHAELPVIRALIESTEFTPRGHKVAADVLDLCGQILRDADMAQTFNQVWFQQIIFGLSAEWGQTPLQVLKMQPRFLASLIFLTTWAQERFGPEAIEEKIDEANRHIRILERS